MKKSFLPAFAIILLLLLIAASLLGHAAGLDIISSTAPLHNVLRSVLVIAFLALIFTTRPRALVLRAGLGVVAAVMIGASIHLLRSYALMPLDCLMYIASAIVLAGEALENEPVTHLTPVHKLGSA